MKEKIAEERKLSYEEFQLFYESTEKVTDRRLGANRWNYSICTAILVANAGLLNWGISKPTFLVISVVGVLILSGMATLFCSLWIGQIKDFKELNNAKFNVLNKMAPHILFSDNPNDPRVSYEPFEKEWDSLQKAKAVQEVGKSNLIALKASNMEYLIPKAFRVLFIFIAISIFLFSGMNWKHIYNSSTLEIKTSTEKAQAIK